MSHTLTLLLEGHDTTPGLVVEEEYSECDVVSPNSLQDLQTE